MARKSSTKKSAAKKSPRKKATASPGSGRTSAAKVRSIVQKEVVYDGEDYDREVLEETVDAYQAKHESDLRKLEDLQKAHDSIAREMTKDLAETKSAWECVKGMATDDFAANFRVLLERVPLVNEFVADRPVADLLREKITLAERRTKEVGQFLTTIEDSIVSLQSDVARLNKKVVIAATNEEKAARRILDLRDLEARLVAELATYDEQRSAAFRKKETQIAEVKQAIWETGARLRLYSNAEDRLAAIAAMNRNFLAILTNLHGNMQSLFDAGQEVLDELRGNLAGLATAAQASEISMDMQEAMESLKKSVNRVAILASNTSLYLTQNVERMMSEMKMYDEATEELVQSNLAAEREIQEQRIDETIALAEKEHGLMQDALEGQE